MLIIIYNVLTALTQIYFFLIILRAKASHNILYFSYIFGDYIFHKKLSAKYTFEERQDF